MAILTDTEMIEALGDDIYRLLNVAIDSDLAGVEPLQSALEKTNRIVESYLRRRYAIPLTQNSKDIVDEAVVSVAVDIASYYIAGRTRPELVQDGGPIRQLFDDARTWLRDIGKGMVHIDQDPLTEGGANTYVGSRTVILRNDVRAVPTETVERGRRSWFQDF